MDALALLSNDGWSSLMRALLHSLWLAAVVAAALYLILRQLPAKRAGARYALCLAAMALVILSTAVAWRIPGMGSVAQPATSVPKATPAAPVVPAGPVVLDEDPVALIAAVLPWWFWASVGWLFGVMLMLLRMTWSLLGTWRLRLTSRRAEDHAVCALAEEVRSAMGLGRRVSVLINDKIRSPMVMGAFWPALLLPASIVGNLSPDQLRAILAHEMAHIRRYDYLVNVLQMVLESLFFFNPAFWWISRQIRIEREACCDAAAVGETGAASDYAAVLLLLGRKPPSPPALASAFANGPRPTVLDRFRRILSPADMPRMRLSWYSLLAVGVLSFTLLAGICIGASEAVNSVRRGIEGGIDSQFAGGQGGGVWYFFRPEDGRFLFAFVSEDRLSTRQRHEVLYSEFLLCWNDRMVPVVLNLRAGTLKLGPRSFSLEAGRAFLLSERDGAPQIEQKKVVLPFKEVRASDGFAVQREIVKQCIPAMADPLDHPSNVERVELVRSVLREVKATAPSTSQPVRREATLHVTVVTEGGAKPPDDLLFDCRVKGDGEPVGCGGEIRTGRMDLGVPAGEAWCVLEPSSAGYAPVFSEPFRIAAGEERDLNLVLGRGFEGVIELVGPDGKAVSGAKVRGEFRYGEVSASGYCLGELTSDRKGIVRVPDAVGKPFHASVVAPGFQPAKMVVTLKKGESVRYALKAAQPATGTVVSHDGGKTVAGALLFLARRDPKASGPHFPEDAFGKADAQGRFRLDRLQDGVDYFIQAQAPGYGPSKAVAVTAGMQDITISLPGELTVRGTIVGDVSDLPKRWGGRRWFGCQQGNRHWRVDITPDGKVNRFEIRSLLPGKLVVSVGKRRQTLILDRSLDDFVVDLTKPPYPTRPFVLKLAIPNGEPSPAGTVEFFASGYPESSVVRGRIANGEVRVDVPVPRKVTWHSRDVPGYWLEPNGKDLLVPEGDEPFVAETRLFAAGLLRGEFLEADGLPADHNSHIRVIVVKAPPGCDMPNLEGWLGGAQLTEGSAQFVVPRLPLGGTYRLIGSEHFGKKVRRMAVSRDVTLTAEQPIQDVRLRFAAKGLTAGGRAVGPDGAPAPNVKVGLYCHMMAYASAITDERGQFQFAELNPAIEYEVRLGGYGDLTLLFDKAPFDPQKGGAVLHARPAKAVRGVVLDAKGKPAKDVHVSSKGIADGKSWPSARRPTNERGEFEVGGMRDGRYRLTAQAYDELRRVTAEGTCEVTAGQADVVIRLLPKD